MISSAALPNVAFSKPPMPLPNVAAKFSVAQPIRPANGMIATHDIKKIQRWPACINSMANATGAANSSQYNGVVRTTRSGVWPVAFVVDELIMRCRNALELKWRFTKVAGSVLPDLRLGRRVHVLALK